MPISDYVQRYHGDWGNLMQRQFMSSSNQHVGSGLLTIWSASYQSVRKESEEAAGLMRLWGFLHSDDVWYELIAGACDLELGEARNSSGLQPSAPPARGSANPVLSYYHGQAYIPPSTYRSSYNVEESGEWGEKMKVPQWLHNLASCRTAFMDAIRVLLRHSLIEAGEQPLGYSMHPVVRKWCTTIVDESEKLDLLKLAMGIVSGLNVRWEQGDHESWVESQRRYPHVLRVHARWRRAVNHRWNGGSRNVGWFLRIYHNLGLVVGKMMDFRKAAQMLEQSVATRESVLGREHPLTLSSVCLLSRAYTDTGRIAKAEEMLTRVQKAYSKRGDVPDLRVAEMRYGQGRLWHVQNKLSDAESMYRSAISLIEDRHGSEHRIIAKATSRLGGVYETQGQLGKAEKFHIRALAMDEKRLGGGNANAFSTILRLGHFYQSQGRFSEAAEQFWRIGEAWRKSGFDVEQAYHPWYCLGRVYWQWGLLAEAEDMLQYALSGYQKQRGKFGYYRTDKTASNLEKVRKGQAFER